MNNPRLESLIELIGLRIKKPQKNQLDNIPVSEFLLREISDFEIPDYIKVHLKREITYVWQIVILSDQALRNISGISDVSVYIIRKAMVDWDTKDNFKHGLLMQFLAYTRNSHEELNKVVSIGEERSVEVKEFILEFFNR